MSLRILDLCKKRGMTQTELAEKIGLSRVGLSKAVNGNPTVGTLERVANALDVPITELFDAKTDDELTALIQYKGDFYKATTLTELEEVVSRIKESRHSHL